MIKFFNAYGRVMDEFKPINLGEVKMYTCGPTIWNYPHIGNYRTFLFEDLLRRYLKYRGFKVTQVMNLTDVDDRIIKMCREGNLDLKKFTEPYAKAFFEDLDYLKVERAELYPRATDNINEMVAIVQGLLDKGYAYKSEDGSIYFKISKFPNYGKLSGLKLGELKAGARVRQDDYDKDSAQDFALWKAWDENDGKIFWETSLGRGRPGWHIECSAMSMKYLGEHFDIHTGGVDNIFPHHENEIAQSEAYTGKKFVNFWIEAEHLLVNGQKMAKRLGNFITVHQLKKKDVSGTALRLFLLSGLYRTQLNFTEQALEQAQSSVKRISEFVSRLRDYAPKEEQSSSEVVSKLVADTRAKYVDSLDNDLDTPRGLAAIFEFITEGNRLLDKGSISRDDAKAMLDFMVVDFDSVFALIGSDDESIPREVEKLLEERLQARASKNWKLSDSIRSKLLELGFEVQDTQQGQKVRKRN